MLRMLARVGTTCSTILVAMALATAVSAQPQMEPPLAPIVVTSGEHVMRVAPDVAWVDS